eukprot:Polyplicarium_translucidae@DN3377_c1_g1_i4.p1
MWHCAEQQSLVLHVKKSATVTIFGPRTIWTESVVPFVIARLGNLHEAAPPLSRRNGRGRRFVCARAHGGGVVAAGTAQQVSRVCIYFLRAALRLRGPHN